MTSPKSLIAILLLATISIVACKKDNITPKGDALFIDFNSQIAASEEFPYKRLQITADASFEIRFTGEKKEIIQLPGNIHDSLKPYLSSFPRAAIKADPQTTKYSGRGANDMPFQTFSYVEVKSNDTTKISIDQGIVVPYIDEFQKKINQTIINCKLLRP
ncbi:hypothetical protein [Chitinophaga sp. RAB17]|uniref:hypothetical protein n=1 Tax=Chitinophaga sp. RAB17 TaxID=3233049 RepID=UPI003F910F87